MLHFDNIESVCTIMTLLCYTSENYEERKCRILQILRALTMTIEIITVLGLIFFAPTNLIDMAIIISISIHAAILMNKLENEHAMLNTSIK